GILDEGENAGHEVPNSVDADALVSAESEALIREIARFEEVIERAADEHRPHVVATYTRDIAETFNTFYRECPVLTADDPETRAARLAVVSAAKTAVGNALDALGVAAPESM
ncbi:MAG: DALR anticodon-binding domain-containing protein, partial [Halapricum sp.]